MDEIATKPLLFVKPLSESLQKLKEVIEEVAEEEGIEIFEVDELNEVTQLLPTIGQSLTLCSAPKKTAMILQQNRKVIKKIRSKVLLLTAKQIPRKTLDKFDKIGLTECIVEPVAPKTLLYKVKLLLRSIKAKGEDDDAEMTTKSLADNMDAKTSKPEDHQRKHSDDDGDAESLDYLSGKRKTGDELELEADIPDAKKKTYEEDAIETDWKSQMKKKNQLELEEAEDYGKKKNEYEEEEIDTYYKNKTEYGEADVIDDLDIGKTNGSDAHLEADYDIHKRKNDDLDLDIELPDLAAKKNEEDDIELPDMDINAEDEDVDHIETYYKNKTNKLDDLDLEEEKELTQEAQADDDYDLDDLPKEKLDLDLEDSEDYGKKKRQDDDIELPDDLGIKQEVEMEDFDPLSGESNKLDLDLEEEQELRQKGKNQNLDGDDNNDPHEGKVDHIEKYYKPKGDKSDDIDLDALADEVEKKQKRNDDLEDDELPDFNEGNVEHLDHGHMMGESSSIELDLDGDSDDDLINPDLDGDGSGDGANDIDLDADLELEHDDTDLDDIDLQKKNSDDDDIDLDDIHAKSEEELDDLDPAKKKERLDLDLDDDLNMRQSNEDLEGGELKKKDPKRTNAKADRIKTHWGMKNDKEEEQDWGNLNKKDQSQDLDLDWGKKKEEELGSNAQDNDLGEQTIDYGQLKAQFAGISIDAHGKRKVKGAPEYEFGDGNKKNSGYTFESGGPVKKAEKSEEEKAAEEKEKDTRPVHHPKPNGLDIAIQALQIVTDKDSDIERIFKFLSRKIHDRHNGLVTFFILDTNKREFDQRFHANTDLFEDLSEEEVTTRTEAWNEKKEDSLEVWADNNLPVWSDPTFRDKTMEFLYPLYEGVSHLGFAVVQFEEGIKEEKAKEIEIILECARGAYLHHFHKHGGETFYGGGEKSKKKKEKKGFFSKVKSFFGKMVG